MKSDTFLQTFAPKFMANNWNNGFWNTFSSQIQSVRILSFPWMYTQKHFGVAQKHQLPKFDRRRSRVTSNTLKKNDSPQKEHLPAAFMHVKKSQSYSAKCWAFKLIFWYCVEKQVWSDVRERDDFLAWDGVFAVDRKLRLSKTSQGPTLSFSAKWQVFSFFNYRFGQSEQIENVDTPYLPK